MALFALKLLLVLALLLGLTLLWLELRHRLRPASPLRLQAGPFKVEAGGAGLEVSGTITLSNPHQRMEVMVPEIELRPTLLGRGDLGGITVSSRIEALHPDEDSRPDGYWAAYIVKGNKSTQARIRIRLGGSGARPLTPPCSTPCGWRFSGSTTAPSGGCSAAMPSWYPCSSLTR